MSRKIFKEIISDVKAELGRLGVQGQAELAGALFNGNAYVPYGDGQQAPEPDKAKEPPQQQQQMGGREM